METSKHTALKAPTGGFSLVEVTLAIGIISFAFLSLLALLPVGLKSIDGAINMTVGSQIIQRIVDDAGQKDFDILKNDTTPMWRYFDDQGNEVPRSNSIYSVVSRVIYPASRSGVGGVNSSNSLTLIVQVARNPGRKTLILNNNGFIEATGDVEIISRALTVAKMK